ncbi:MAG: hypothetical protein ABSD28_05785 [Tepidisphaeraceae bacterium]
MQERSNCRVRGTRGSGCLSGRVGHYDIAYRYLARHVGDLGWVEYHRAERCDRDDFVGIE